ncbi:uncharacterized protein [Palaemon carinicauda]|uniref:uncharacterized protein n=1 Tax=Palaemon carinicauda TaxID=392227 RepID=UPI0035B5F533
MSDAGSWSAAGGGGEMALEEEDVDEIRLGPLVDELSIMAGRNFTKQEMVQAIISCKFDLKSAVQLLNGRESSVPRQCPEKRKTYEGHNLLVQYQLPISYCHNSAIFVENKTLDRLPLHRIVRDWLSEILRKRSRQKREEEKCRYFRNRNESQCSEDSVVTTSGDSQDVVGDSSQDLSEDSQDMIVDCVNQDFGEEVEISLETSKVEHQPQNDLSANTVLLSEGGFKELLPSNINIQIQSSSIAESSLTPVQLPVPKLQITPNTSNLRGESGLFQIPSLKLPFKVDENSSKVSSHPPPMGMIENSETGFVNSCSVSGNKVFESTKSSVNTCKLGSETKGPSLFELANSSVTGSKPQFDNRNKDSNSSDLANSRMDGNNPQCDFGVKGPDQCGFMFKRGLDMQGPKLSMLAHSSLSNNEISTSKVGLGSLTLGNSLCNNVSQDSNKPNLPLSACGVAGSSGIQFSIPKLNTSTVNCQKSINFSPVSGPQSLSSLADSNLSGNDPNFSGRSIGSTLSALATTSLGNANSLLSSVPDPNSILSLSSLTGSRTEGNISAKSLSSVKSSPIDIKLPESSNTDSGSPSLFTLASTYLGSNSLSISSVPPLETGKKGICQGNENTLKVGESKSVFDMAQGLNITEGFNNSNANSIDKPGRPPTFTLDSNLNKSPSNSSMSNLLKMNDSNRPFGDHSFLSSLANLAVSTTDVDTEVGFQITSSLQLKPCLKPPPGFEHVVPQGDLLQKECLETLLIQEEVDMNGDIDLLSALLKPQAEEESERKTDIQSTDLFIEPQICPFRYDATLWKRKPSSFGKVMGNIPYSPQVKRLTEKVICVPFKIFKFDTPSPDEVIQEALQNRRDPGWYKLVTKERHSRRW